MTTTQWIITVIASFLGGGAVGAVINQLVTTYRNRRQPVFYTQEVIDVFDKKRVYGGVKATIGIEKAGKSGVNLELENFAIALLTIINKGNQDIAEFNFGITLDEGTEAFDVKITNPDRHHCGICAIPPDVPNFRRELDFTLKPFNRGDSYDIALHLTYLESVGKIKISSAHPTQFVKKTEATGIKMTSLVILTSALSTFGLVIGLASMLGTSPLYFWIVNISLGFIYSSIFLIFLSRK